MFKETVLYSTTKRIVDLKGNERRVFKDVLDNDIVKSLIIDLNTRKQLKQQHIDSLGNELFNRFTQRSVYGVSDPLGRGGQPYEVYQTGDYYDSFQVFIRGNAIVIDSNPEKPNGSLFEMYNENIEGLTDESKVKLIALVRDLYINYVRKYIGGLV